MDKKRMIVFGCGYVGRILAEAAHGLGYEVWVHSRNVESLNRVQGIPVGRKIVGNLQSADWHDRLSGDWDLIFNLVSSAGGGLDGYTISYVEGNRSIRDWAAGRQVKRFVYTSATSVYPQTEGEWVEEDNVPMSDRLSASGQILRQAELELLDSEVFTERIIARLAGIYGPGRHLYLDRIRAGETRLPGNGEAWLSLIYRSDAVEALLRLGSCSMKDPTAVYNVVDDRPSRKQEIVDWLASQLNCAQVEFDPSLGGARGARRETKDGLPNRRVSNRNIREKVGWSPKYPDFKAGYQEIFSLG